MALSGRNSLLKQQITAGSLANLFPGSEFKVPKTGKTLEKKHASKETLGEDRDVVDIQLQVLQCEYYNRLHAHWNTDSGWFLSIIYAVNVI